MQALRRHKKQWVAASSTFNFMQGDPLLDWLKIWRRGSNVTQTTKQHSTKQHNTKQHNTKQHTSFTKFILQRGNEFETMITKSLIKQIKPHNTIDINALSTHGDITARKEAYVRTLDAMAQGTHMILSGMLMDKRSRTFGVPDILMRVDIAANMFGIEINRNIEESRSISTKSNKKEEKYIIIDVKYSTLSLKSDGIHILNSASFPAYKAQLYVYAKALSRHQKCTRAFILGRCWSYTQQGKRYFGNNPFQRLGCIDYSGVDSDFIKRTKAGIKWIRKVNRPKAANWSNTDPKILPNMCNHKDSPWREYKNHLAQEIGELTMLWMVGPKNRDRAIKSKVTSWRDPRCNANILGISGERGRLLDAIININRDYETDSNPAVIRPTHVQHRLYDWHLAENEYFVDFETTSGCFGDISIPSNNSNLIFMIGVGWYDRNKKWKYKSFVANELTTTEEQRICYAFARMVGTNKCWHWSCAEPSRFRVAVDRVTSSSINWCDLLRVWMKEPIVVATCFTFGLKDVAKAMFRHGLIKTTWSYPQHDENIKRSGIDGLLASVMAHTDLSDMQDVIDYNEVDVRTLCEMLDYLRNNMIKRKFDGAERVDDQSVPSGKKRSKR